MANLVMLHSKQFLSEFLPYFEYDDFKIIVISDTLQSNGTTDIVYPAEKLLPPAPVIELYNVGKMKRYKQSYFEWLEVPEVQRILTYVVKLCQDGHDILMLTSKAEWQFNFMKYLAEYMETIYNVRVHMWKDFREYKYKSEYGSISPGTVEIMKSKFKDIIPILMHNRSKEEEEERRRRKEEKKRKKKEKKKAKGLLDDEDPGESRVYFDEDTGRLVVRGSKFEDFDEETESHNEDAEKFQGLPWDEICDLRYGELKSLCNKYGLHYTKNADRTDLLELLAE